MEAVNKLSEEDRLKMNLLAERGQRIAAEKANLGLVAKALDDVSQKLNFEKAAFNNELRTKYKIEVNDEVDTTTGDILRAKQEAKPAAPVVLVPEAPKAEETQAKSA